jgi:hypothetical protein
MGDAYDEQARWQDYVPMGAPVVPKDRRGVVRINVQVAQDAPVLADLVGGVVVVIMGAEAGDEFGGHALSRDSVLLLGESATKHTLLRAVPVSQWMQIQALDQDDSAAVRRAERVVSRVTRRGDVTPMSPPPALTGNAGALVAWAWESACTMREHLEAPIEEGGLGVTMDTFHVTGYLTDSGGSSIPDYLQHILASQSRDYMALGLAATRRKAGSDKSVPSVDMSVERLAAHAAALEVDDDVVPPTVRVRYLLAADGASVPFSAGPAAQMVDEQRAEAGVKRSGSSQKSEASLRRAEVRLVMKELRGGGVPTPAAQALADGGYTLMHAQRAGAIWVEAVCAEAGVELSPSALSVLGIMFPDATPPQSPAAPCSVQGSVGNSNVPLTEQRPENPKTPAEKPHSIFYFFKCSTPKCKCPASYNGGPDRACCKTCHAGNPCTKAGSTMHDFPSQLPVRTNGEPFPTSQKVMAEAFCDRPHVTSKPTSWRKGKTRDEMVTLLWESNFDTCEPCVRDSYKTVAEAGASAAEDAAEEEDGEWSEQGSEPALDSNRSESDDEAVEVQAPAAPARAQRVSQPVRQAQVRSAAVAAERAVRDAEKAEAKAAAAAAAERGRQADVRRERDADEQARVAAAEHQRVADGEQQHRRSAEVLGEPSGDEMTPRTRADANDILRVAKYVKGDILLCIEGLELDRLRKVVTAIGSMFEGSKEQAKMDWMPDAMLPLINQQIALAATAMLSDLATQIRSQTESDSPEEQLPRVFMALAAMAATTSPQGRAASGGGRATTSTDARANEAVVAAAERLGKSLDASKLLDDLRALAASAAQRLEEAGPALRAGVAAAVQHEEYGADISLLLHQEKLDVPKGATVTNHASRVWTLLYAVAQRQRDAIVSHFTEVMPVDLDIARLVQAVACGKLSVEVMVPKAIASAKSSVKAVADTRDAVMQAWPGVMAIQAELNARDSTAQATFLKLARDLFNVKFAAKDPVTRILEPALTAMQKAFTTYLLDGGKEPTWQEIALKSELTTVANMMMRTELETHAVEQPPALSQAEQQKRARERATAAAAAVAERERARVAAAATGAAAAEAAGGAAKPRASYVPVATWDKMSPAAQQKFMKDRAAQEAKEE